jgi:hypothetical protein
MCFEKEKAAVAEPRRHSSLRRASFPGYQP